MWIMRGTGRRALMAVAAVTLALASAAPAQAEPTFDLGAGTTPDIAVDGAGAAHVAWHAAGDVVRYCKVPRGARGCTFARGFSVTGSNGSTMAARGRPHVFVTPAGHVVILDARGGVRFSGATWSDPVYLWRSTNGGQSFASSPELLAYRSGSGDVPVSPEEATFGPTSNRISWVNESGRRTEFQSGSWDAPASTRALLRDAAPWSSAVAVDAQGRPVVVTENPDLMRLWRFPTTAPYSGLNSAASWGAPGTFDGDGGEMPAMANGPRGLFVLYEDSLPTGDQLRVRRVASGAADGGTAISAPRGGGGPEGDLFQDASGRLHATWGSRDGLLWRTSADGSSWGQTSVLHNGPYGRARVAAAADGGGFAVFGTSLFTSGTIRATVLAGPPAPCHGGDPRAECAGSGGGSGSGAAGSDGSGGSGGAGGTAGDPSGGGGGTLVACRTADPRPICRPPACELTRRCAPAARRIGSRVVAVALLQDRRTCVRRSVTVRLKVRSVRRVRGRRVRGPRTVVLVRRVTFVLDGRRRRVDRRAPWQATFGIAGTPGSRHRVVARAVLRVRRGRARFRTRAVTVSRGFRICPA